MDSVDDQLWGIIYVSASSEDFTVEETGSIINEVRPQFKMKDVSGLVINAQRNILIYMEGGQSAVKCQYSLACRDVRHKNLIKIFDATIPYRYFSDFGISFYFVDDKFKSLNDFDSEPSRAYLDECLSIDDSIMRTIKEFLKNNR